MGNIHLCGEYFKECFTALGIKPESVHYAWTSDLAKEIEYWEKVVRIAKSASLQRTWRALPIMGRETSLTDMETAWVFYPCMQAADIFQQKLNVACASMDQRKDHMLARDAAEVILADDNYITITRGIFEGRKFFENLQKGIVYYLSIKTALILIFLLTVLAALPLPFSPIQIILLELFMDLGASAGFTAEPAESGSSPAGHTIGKRK
jgi:tryptophanyl-tRNA synthetase